MSESEVKTISTIRRVFYDTYANLPVTGIMPEDLGYATDTLTLYRWNGAAWQAITVYTTIAAKLTVLWTDPIADIPDGWIICDGNNGTPNMLTRFPQGVATAATDPGTTGGATSKTTAGHTHTIPAQDIVTTGTSASVLGTRQSATGLVYAGKVITIAGDNSADDNYGAAESVESGSKTDSITDIRPLNITVAYIRKT